MNYQPRDANTNRCTLIVRIWKRADEAGTWIGEVQNVITGERDAVVGLEKVIELLRQKILTLLWPSPADDKSVSEM